MAPDKLTARISRIIDDARDAAGRCDEPETYDELRHIADDLRALRLEIERETFHFRRVA